MRDTKTLTPNRGYFALPIGIELPEDALIAPSRNMIFRPNGILESFGGFSSAGAGIGGTISHLLGRGFASIGTNETTDRGSGNVVLYQNNTLFFSATGTVRALVPDVDSSLLTIAYPLGLGTVSGTGTIGSGTEGVITIVTNNGLTPAMVGDSIKVTGAGGTIVHDAIITSIDTDMGGAPTLILMNFNAPAGIDGAVTWEVNIYTTTIPQVAVRDPIHGGYKSPRQVGLAPQTETPNLTYNSVGASPGVIKIQGSLSCVLAALRTDTGDESFASPSSAIVNFIDNSALVTFPPGRTDGCDAWRLYFTKRGRGSQPDWFWYKDYTEVFVAAQSDGGISRTVEVGLNDSDLKPKQPVLDAFAPVGSVDFMFSLGNVMHLVGTYNGLGVSASVPGFSGMYPPDNVNFLTERAKAIVTRPQDNYVFILCENSIWVAVLTGAVTGSPTAIKSMVDNYGVVGRNAATNANGELYLFTAGKQPARLSNNGFDTSFGEDVKLEMASWDATKVVVSYDEKPDVVTYAHNRSVYCFHPNQGENGRWSTPIDLDQILSASKPTGNIVSAFTLQSIEHVVCWNTTTSKYDMWLFDNGTDGSNWIVQHAWNLFGHGFNDKTTKLVKHHVSTPGAVTLTGKVFGNDDITTAKGTYTFPSPGGRYTTPWLEINVPDLQTISWQLSGSGYQHRISASIVDFLIGGMLV